MQSDECMTGESLYLVHPHSQTQSEIRLRDHTVVPTHGRIRLHGTQVTLSKTVGLDTGIAERQDIGFVHGCTETQRWLSKQRLDEGARSALFG